VGSYFNHHVRSDPLESHNVNIDINKKEISENSEYAIYNNDLNHHSTVKLTDKEFTNETNIEIVRAITYCDLIVLTLAGNAITNKGAALIAEGLAADCAALRFLDLRENNIGMYM
jgi:hypothetical protein